MPLFEGHVPHINDLFDQRTGTRGILNRAIVRPPQHWRLYFLHEAQIVRLPGLVGEHYYRTINTLNNAGIKPFVAGGSRAVRVDELIGLDHAPASLLTQIDLDDPLRTSRFSRGVGAIIGTMATYDGVALRDLMLTAVTKLSEAKIRDRLDVLSNYSEGEVDAYIGHLKLVLRGWDLGLAT